MEDPDVYITYQLQGNAIVNGVMSCSPTHLLLSHDSRWEALHHLSSLVKVTSIEAGEEMIWSGRKFDFGFDSVILTMPYPVVRTFLRRIIMDAMAYEDEVFDDICRFVAKNLDEWEADRHGKGGVHEYQNGLLSYQWVGIKFLYTLFNDWVRHNCYFAYHLTPADLWKAFTAIEFRKCFPEFHKLLHSIYINEDLDSF
jgi:hypothetical protein